MMALIEHLSNSSTVEKWNDHLLQCAVGTFRSIVYARVEKASFLLTRGSFA